MEYEYLLPADWENPRWTEYSRIHDWRNYASDDVQKEWHNFTEYQKKILAISFNRIADLEEWD